VSLNQDNKSKGRKTAWLDTRQPVCQGRTAKTCAKPKRPVFVTLLAGPEWPPYYIPLLAAVESQPWIFATYVKICWPKMNEKRLYANVKHVGHAG
jgi:hypothetical protein